MSDGLEKAYEIEQVLRSHSASLRRYIQYMLRDFNSSADATRVCRGFRLSFCS